MREPENYAEAAKDLNWQKAMEEEMHALAENETWDLVDVPKGVKSIGLGIQGEIQHRWIGQHIEGPISGKGLHTASRHQL